ncbi:hypothetical protein LTR10_021705 [Elasticomyces elasticus]|uniref:Rhodopsin domain-containing protein n=1 Tax=Exophiala sideris TaxID=1016849 RepID=A0ABR0IUU0_9EURO|nr:hypothetical protein LTR10_021705 [Elasticomyces elasticus]KAK5021150.1 hypothetical protein LTS07_011237 [Exophiala sideris]KAK5023761.1 hypothetical protein LTR13_011139 [Exophiala sideris]KAK5048840.1 hypothetical protein LTR69_011254 [Exophiala sideris]KAK5176299.1 hypothetical protein LTR44_011130 [Eurotiomycetes sp. CCFEE 6388]
MASAFDTEVFTLLGIGVFVVAVRTVSRLATAGIRGLWADDYLMLFATVVYGLESGTAYAVGAWWHGLANNGMTDAERRMLDPNSQEYEFRVNGSKTQLVGWSLYTLLLWTLKLCMIIFYQRLTEGLDYMKRRVWLGYAIVICTYIATISSILGGCHSFHKNWQIYPNPGNHCQPAISKIDLYVTVILNVFSDVYLLTIPIPLLWKADVPMIQKFSLTFIFGGAVFVMAAGILRAALILHDPVGGAQAAGSWAVRETFVAVVVCNLPLVYQGIRRMVKSASGSRLYSRSASRMGYNKSADEPDFEMLQAQAQAQAPTPRLSMPEFDAREEHQQHEFFKAV